MTEPAAPSSSPAALAQRDELLVAAEATVIPTLIALHGRQRQALEALRVCIAALGETAPAGLVAQEAELAAALAATETALRGYGFSQVDASGGEDVAGRAGDSPQGAFINSSTFYGTVIGYQENQAALISSWACYKCNADNPPNTSFCIKCSAQLLQICPECRQNTSMVASKLCGNCGYPFGIAVKRSELRRQIVEQEEILKRNQLQYVQSSKLRGDENISCCVVLVIFLGFCGTLSIDNYNIELMLLAFMFFFIIAAMVAPISKRMIQKHEMAKTEMSAKIHQIEQSIIQFQRALEETDIRKV